eukprot:scaffold689_cov375-Prasinococcus_capsulatus_cf.AAC.21
MTDLGHIEHGSASRAAHRAPPEVPSSLQSLESWVDSAASAAARSGVHQRHAQAKPNSQRSSGDTDAAAEVAKAAPLQPSAPRASASALSNRTAADWLIHLERQLFPPMSAAPTRSSSTRSTDAAPALAQDAAGLTDKEARLAATQTVGGGRQQRAVHHSDATGGRGDVKPRPAPESIYRCGIAPRAALRAQQRARPSH